MHTPRPLHLRLDAPFVGSRRDSSHSAALGVIRSKVDARLVVFRRAPAAELTRRAAGERGTAPLDEIEGYLPAGLRSRDHDLS
jgi:hypothetical protein